MEHSELGDWTGVAVKDKNQKTLDELFPKLRAEADAWAGARTAYMLARLEKGAHPDTDSNFWAEWKPAEPPSLEVYWAGKAQDRVDAARLKDLKIGAFSLIGILAIGLWSLRCRSARRNRG